MNDKKIWESGRWGRPLRWGLLLIGLVVAGCLTVIRPTGAEPTAAYPPSSVINYITFDWSTYRKLAPGSDNWAITWADDGHQYAVWGDGGGFGGTNDDGRVSLGVGRIEGPFNGYNGANVWGGKNGENPSQFNGKSYGILAVNGDLYMWRCGEASSTTAYNFQELYRSTDRAKTWQFTGVRFDQAFFPGSDRGFYCPTFLQFGQNYAGARDSYVYIYAPEIQTTAWAVQKPGKITLLRVEKTRLADPAAYDYFAGLDSGNNPTWTKNPAGRLPVFQDAVNGVMMTSAIYNPGIDRYLLITEHTDTLSGNIGIYDAPAPWGPWTTVLLQGNFGAPTIESSTFFWNFSSKWFRNNGRDFTLVFTGVNSMDAWNTVDGRIVLFSDDPGGPTPTPPPPPTTGGCGGLVREGETGVLSGEFKTFFDEGASGSRYVAVPKNTARVNSVAGNPHKAIYCFTVARAGSYLIRGVVSAPDADSNSFFVTVDGQPTAGYLWDTAITGGGYQGSFVSDRNGSGRVNVWLNKGTHEIIVYLREDGTALDRLELISLGNPYFLPFIRR